MVDAHIRYSRCKLNLDSDMTALSAPLAPPDGGYGWVMVLAIFWNNAHHWGILSSYGVFMQYFLSHPEFVSGTYLDYALIGGLAASQSCLIAPLATTVHHKYGIKLAVRDHNGRDRHKRADLFNGCTYNDGPMGPSWTYRTLAIVQVVVCSCCVLSLRDNDRANTGSSNRDLRAINFRVGRRYEVWQFLTWSFFSVMGFMVIWFSLSTYSRSIGLSTAQGSIVTAVMNVGQIVGRPLVGYYNDAVGRINIATAATFVSGVLCLSLWVWSRSYASILCFAFFGGSLFGTFLTVMAPLSAEVAALKEIRSCLTIMWLVCVLPATSDMWFPL
ncbi:major facilitator superfamily domain-containing protein [Aspergillus nidulans var. acristatus]